MTVTILMMKHEDDNVDDDNGENDNGEDNKDGDDDAGDGDGDNAEELKGERPVLKVFLMDC